MGLLFLFLQLQIKTKLTNQHYQPPFLQPWKLLRAFLPTVLTQLIPSDEALFITPGQLTVPHQTLGPAREKAGATAHLFPRVLPQILVSFV